MAEKLSTFHEIAEALGVPYFKVQRAAKVGIFPTYRLFNSRPLARMSEVFEAIERTREGGGNV